MEGPAGGRPCISAPAKLPVRRKFTIRSSTCACRIEGALKYSPAAAVPVSTKIPEPMMAPIPSAVSDQGPSVFCSRWPGASDSVISLSIDLQQRSWFLCSSAASLAGDCAKRLRLLHLNWKARACARALGILTTNDKRLTLCLAAYHLFNFALLGPARVVAALLGPLGFDFL